MKTSDLDYFLPSELIAQKPIIPRDAAKLLVFNRQIKEITESTFLNLPDFLQKGDVLVLNKTKVFPARTWAKNGAGRRIEILFLAEKEPQIWEVMVRGKVNEGEKLFLTPTVFGFVSRDSSTYLKINIKKPALLKLLAEIGEMPLPPYIKRKAVKADEKNYQTVFAQKTGSAAAPTAGLHFTSRLLAKLKRVGIQIEYVTLHVGLGTFAPIKTDKVEDHPIHAEIIEIDVKTTERLNAAKKQGRRLIACGTTVMRTLESAAKNHHIAAFKGPTSLFIYPGYHFKIVDGLITNFHTPKSSLLALVFAFAGKKDIQKLYRFAIKNRYRFFSYGDGMLIL